MPALFLEVAVDFDELLQNGTATSYTLRCKTRRVVEVAVHVAIMLVVRILRPKKRSAHGACEMLDMELFVWAARLTESEKL